MKRVDVVKKGNKWIGEPKHGGRYTVAPTKAEVVAKAARKAKKDRKAVTVRIHDRDGLIQEERTYPRSADPRSSKG